MVKKTSRVTKPAGAKRTTGSVPSTSGRTAKAPAATAARAKPTASAAAKPAAARKPSARTVDAKRAAAKAGAGAPRPERKSGGIVYASALREMIAKRLGRA